MDLGQTTNGEPSLSAGRLRGRFSIYVQKWKYQLVTNVRTDVLELPFPALGLADKVKNDA